MKFKALSLSGAFKIELEKHGDSRGFFARLYCNEEFSARGLETCWSQCNMSFSASRGTIRGLHFQRPPAAETKLIRCTAGAVFDVIVDLRLGSPTYGQWCGERLDQHDRAMIYVPEGFAHGFQTLSDNVEMLYFHSHPYSAKDEGGLRWNDHNLGINWPLSVSDMSSRDINFPILNELEPIAL